MSYEQKLLKGMSENPLTPDACNRLIRALDAIPEVFHADFLTAYFNEQAPEEKPEDYAVVKTFTSSEFHVGDELTDDRLNAIYFGDVEGAMIIVLEDGGTDVYQNDGSWHRTGRNFPAIPAILEELKKA